MGVSPLVLLNRQVKNSKSAIVNVTLPGQTVKSTVETQGATDILAPQEAIASDSDRIEQLVLPMTPSLEPAIVAPEITQLTSVEEVGDSLTREANNPVEETVSAEPLVDANNPVEETVSAEPLVEEPIRRRRRRSSATE
jgi:ribonuclease E